MKRSPNYTNLFTPANCPQSATMAFHEQQVQLTEVLEQSIFI